MFTLFITSHTTVKRYHLMGLHGLKIRHVYVKTLYTTFKKQSVMLYNNEGGINHIYLDEFLPIDLYVVQ